MSRRRRTGFFHVWALFRKIVGASEFTREVVARAGDVLGLIANISNLLPDCLYRLGIFGNCHNVGNGMIWESPVTRTARIVGRGGSVAFPIIFQHLD